MTKHFFLGLSLTVLLLSGTQPQLSAAAATKKAEIQNYIVLGENIDELVGEFNQFENALKLVFIVGPT